MESRAVMVSGLLIAAGCASAGTTSADIGEFDPRPTVLETCTTGACPELDVAGVATGDPGVTGDMDGNACLPRCVGAECGDDGCGGTCGTCKPGGICVVGICTCMTFHNTGCCGDAVCWFDACGEPGMVEKECAYGCYEAASGGGNCYPWPPCKPSCEGKECGDDGCGGSCGTCKPGGICVAGICTCTAFHNTGCCGDAVCWFDSCGEPGMVQSECAYGCDEAASGGGKCYPGPPCTPSCEGKECGDDGCGGACGSCAPAGECVNGSCDCPPHDHLGCCEAEGQWRICWIDACGRSGEEVSTCPYGCVAGECQPCAPDCDGGKCGDDGCGGQCKCSAKGICVDGSCICANPCGATCCAADEQCCGGGSLDISACCGPTGFCAWDQEWSQFYWSCCPSGTTACAEHDDEFWIACCAEDEICTFTGCIPANKAICRGLPREAWVLCDTAEEKCCASATLGATCCKPNEICCALECCDPETELCVWDNNEQCATIESVMTCCHFGEVPGPQGDCCGEGWHCCPELFYIGVWYSQCCKD